MTKDLPAEVGAETLTDLEEPSAPNRVYWKSVSGFSKAGTEFSNSRARRSSARKAGTPGEVAGPDV
jgi:hypothetical protein